MVDALNLTVRTNKAVFPTTAGQQVVYVLIEALPSESVAGVQMPLNFCLVLDHSGSMSGAKIKNLKEAAKLAVEQMGPHDRVSIVVFDDKVKVVAPGQTAVDPAALKCKIEEIGAEGGTRMSLGMREGLAELQKGDAPDRVSRMLLLTDGETYGDEDECRRLASEAGERGIPIAALGLGEDWKEQLLDAIAQTSGGVSDFIPDGKPDAILDTFRQHVQAAKATIVQNALLALKVVPGVLPRAVWRVTPLIAKLGHRAISERDVQVQLGDIERDRGQSVLVELSVPPRQPGSYRIAQAEVVYDVPGLGRTAEQVRGDVVLSFSEDPSQVSDSDPYVMNLIEKVTAHKLQTRALEEAALGNIPAATQKLRAAATRLLDLGEDELAETALQEADRLERGEGLSSRGTKKLRYETRKLTQKLDDADSASLDR